MRMYRIKGEMLSFSSLRNSRICWFVSSILILSREPTFINIIRHIIDATKMPKQIPR
jgi:hypothetical protein